MPTPATAKWPRPKSEDEWEDMSLDALRLRWRDPNAQRNGRRGQRQDGVDLFGHTDRGTVGAQAKNTDALSETDIVAEIAKAERFKPSLTEYFLTIGGPRDGTIQEFVRTVSFRRVSEGKFAVHVLFFEDVCHELAASPDLVRKYWGAFFAFEALTEALSSALTGPVTTVEAALDNIRALPALEDFARTIAEASEGNVRVGISIDETPQLRAPAGSLERAWHIRILEEHQTHLVPLCFIAVDVDSGVTSFYSVVEDRWLSKNEWLQTSRWFN